MSLEQYAFIAQIISAIAIVLSLIFVGLQVRQGADETAANSKAIRSQVRQSLLNSDLNTIYQIMQYPYLTEQSFESEGQKKEDVQRARTYFLTLYRSRENFWVQHQDGILDTDTYLSYRNTLLVHLTNSDFYLDVWKRMSVATVSGFKQEIDDILKERGRLQ